MKNYVNISAVLSWINLVVGGFFVLCGVLIALTSGNLVSGLLVMLLPAAIVLHSYAALQLRKSIMNPSIPLGNQTPVGIRFMGYVVLVFAIINIVYGVSLIGNIDEVAKQAKLPPEAAKLNISRLLRFAVAFSILFCISIGANALINLRLLKWYNMETKE